MKKKVKKNYQHGQIFKSLCMTIVPFISCVTSVNKVTMHGLLFLLGLEHAHTHLLPS